MNVDEYWRNRANNELVRITAVNNNGRSVSLITGSGFQYSYELIQFINEYRLVNYLTAQQPQQGVTND